MATMIVNVARFDDRVQRKLKGRRLISVSMCRAIPVGDGSSSATANASRQGDALVAQHEERTEPAV